MAKSNTAKKRKDEKRKCNIEIAKVCKRPDPPFFSFVHFRSFCLAQSSFIQTYFSYRSICIFQYMHVCTGSMDGLLYSYKSVHTNFIFVACTLYAVRYLKTIQHYSSMLCKLFHFILQFFLFFLLLFCCYFHYNKCRLDSLM